MKTANFLTVQLAFHICSGSKTTCIASKFSEACFSATPSNGLNSLNSKFLPGCFPEFSYTTLSTMIIHTISFDKKKPEASTPKTAL